MKLFKFAGFLLAIGWLATACRPASPASTTNSAPTAATTNLVTAETPAVAPDACSMILIPHQGTGKTDREIIRLQQKVRDEREPGPWIERLGWMFVAKARESFDPGYYKLAEACATCLASHQPHALEALLLRGHALENLHHFKEAEPLARELVARRGLSFDYGLLGDVLMEQGRLSEAADAYQKMVDQKPDLQAYARIAHLRWLKGDLAGATEVMKLAAEAGSPNAPETAAWANSRLAFFQFQTGDVSGALETCGVALDFQKNYAPALLLQGRLLLANGRNDEAVDLLRRAAQINPLPDYQWVLSEALRAAGQDDEARQVETELARKGAITDPRTYALYLATSGHSPAVALELAQNELNNRTDIFTHDAVAWALAANSQNHAAWQEMQLALAEGTQDARLYFHAAAIATRTGDLDAGKSWLSKALGMMPMLLPSEQKQLQAAAKNLGLAETESADSATATASLFTSEN